MDKFIGEIIKTKGAIEMTQTHMYSNQYNYVPFHLATPKKRHGKTLLFSWENYEGGCLAHPSYIAEVLINQLNQNYLPYMQ